MRIMRRNILIAIALVATQVSIAQVLEKEAPAAIASVEIDENAETVVVDYHNGEKPVTERKTPIMANTQRGVVEYHDGEKPVTQRKSASLENGSEGGVVEYHDGEKPVTQRKSASLENGTEGGVVEYHDGEKPVTQRKSASLENASVGGVVEYHDGEKPVTERKDPIMLSADDFGDDMETRGDEEDPNVIKGTGLNAKVFPNPFENTFTVFLAADVPFAHVKIVSPYGKVIEERTINEEAIIDLNGFDNGVYVVHLSNSREMIMKRVVKR